MGEPNGKWKTGGGICGVTRIIILVGGPQILIACLSKRVSVSFTRYFVEYMGWGQFMSSEWDKPIG